MALTNTATLSGTINQGSISATGAGGVTLSNTVATTGSTSVSAGSVNFTGGLTASGGLSVTGAGSVTSTNGINGTGGITVNTTGTVTVSGGNAYDGAVVLTGGTFRPNSPSAFGSTVGGTTVSGTGTIFATTANTDYGTEAISLVGNGGTTSTTAGSLHTGGSTTSTFDGPITVAGNTLINLDGGSTLLLTNANSLAGTGPNFTVTLAGQSGAGTLTVNGNVNLGTGGTILSATTTVLNTPGNISFAPIGPGTITCSNPIASSAVPGAPSGSITVTSGGTPNQTQLGTTILQDNPGFTGAVTVSAGILKMQTAAVLGTTTGATTITGSPNTNDVVGTLQLAPTSGNLSIAEPFTVNGRQGPGIDVPHIENVNGNNTLTGSTITPNTGGADYNFQSDAGLFTIQSNFSTNGLGSGRNLKLLGSGNGVWSGNISDTSAAPINLFKRGSGTWTLSNANGIRGNTTISGGTLALAVNYAIGGSATPAAPSPLVLGDGTTGGTLATGGFSNTFNQLTLNNSSAIDMGSGASALKFADSSGTGWTAGQTLTINNWNYGIDHVNFTLGTGLTVQQLSQIKFADFHQGASIADGSTTLPVGEVTPQVGDINQDGMINMADIATLMLALANRDTYQATYFSGVSDPAGDLKFILDANRDGLVNNLDIQAEINLVANFISTGNLPGAIPGGESVGSGVSAVPEPASIVLLGLGGLFLTGLSRRRKTRTQNQ